jgi:hypothetical protein
MKKIALFALCAALAVLFAKTASAQKPFEGSVNWKVVSAQMGDQEPHDMTMNIKGDKFEMDVDAGVQGMVHIIVDRANKKFTTVLDAMKMGTVASLPEEDASDSKKDVDLKATGEKSTINGHASELYILTTEKETVKMWVSKDFKSDLAAGVRAAMSNSIRGSKEQKKVFRDFAEKGLFPVRIESQDGGSLELVGAEAKSLPDSKFDVPADVTIMPTNGGMGRGMRGMPHGDQN